MPLTVGVAPTLVIGVALKGTLAHGAHVVLTPGERQKNRREEERQRQGNKGRREDDSKCVETAEDVYDSGIRLLNRAAGMKASETTERGIVDSMGGDKTR